MAIWGEELEEVEQLTCLGSVIKLTCVSDEDINARIYICNAKASVEMKCAERKHHC